MTHTLAIHLNNNSNYKKKSNFINKKHKKQKRNWTKWLYDHKIFNNNIKSTI